QRLPNNDRRLVLERFGAGSSVPLTLQQLGTERGLTRERIRNILHKLFAQIRRTFGPRIPRLLDQVRQYCIFDVCPLTPRLLEELGTGLQSHLGLYLEAHVTMIGALDASIPCWPDGHDRRNKPDGDSRRLAAHLATIVWQAGGHLIFAEAYRRLKGQRR